MGDVAIGGGDDVAVVPEGAGHLVVSTDLSIENVHFRREWITFEEAGWRATTAALSDLAADGADAVGVLISAGLPPDVGDDEFGALMRGVAAAAEAAGAHVLGGDLSRSDRLVVDGVAVGRAARPVTRHGAEPGDILWVSGRFGGPAAAVAAWAAGREPEPAHRDRFARPVARIALGQWLAKRGAKAMIDVSDGVVADAGHLAAASEVAITIALDAIPLLDGVSEASVAASSGEEYELLVAMPPAFRPDGAPVPLARVGMCGAGEGVETTLRGDVVPLPHGFDHFRT